MNPVIIGNATRIYALCEFPSQVPRYVGKTIQPLRLRLVAHLRSARRGPRLPVSWWLAKREKAGKQVCIKWLETVDAGGDWQEQATILDCQAPSRRRCAVEPNGWWRRISRTPLCSSAQGQDRGGTENGVTF